MTSSDTQGDTLNVILDRIEKLEGIHQDIKNTMFGVLYGSKPKLPDCDISEKDKNNDHLIFGDIRKAIVSKNNVTITLTNGYKYPDSIIIELSFITNTILIFNSMRQFTIPLDQISGIKYPEVIMESTIKSTTLLNDIKQYIGQLVLVGYDNTVIIDKLSNIFTNSKNESVLIFKKDISLSIKDIKILELYDPKNLTVLQALGLTKMIWTEMYQRGFISHKNKIDCLDWKVFGDMKSCCPCCEYRNQQMKKNNENINTPCNMNTFCKKYCPLGGHWGGRYCEDDNSPYASFAWDEGTLDDSLKIIKACESEIKVRVAE